MVKRYDVSSVRSPGGRYSHVGEVGSNGRIFHLAGQTGTAPDGTTPEGIEAQSRVVYQNIANVLKDCGMGLDNLVKVTIFLTDPDNIEGWRAVQKEAFGDITPASTLLVVSRLARPEYLVEVEAIAAID
jgi:enamine deaminase RidA (YjgF/YER057c/UK114 family)